MYIFPVISFVLAAIHLFLRRKDLSAEKTVEILLVYIFAITVGMANVFAFIGHAFFADRVAQSIGWAAGSPFQFEVAVADLSFGVLGVLCIWIRGDFWLATAIASAVFGWGVAAGYVKQILVNGNIAVNNAGAVLWVNDVFVPVLVAGAVLWVNDVFMPVLVLSLLAVRWALKKVARHPSQSHR